MKAFKILLIIFSVMFLTTCSYTDYLEKKHVERVEKKIIEDMKKRPVEEIERVYMEYAKLYVEAAEPIMEKNDWDSELIEYVISDETAEKVKKIKEYQEKLKNMADMEKQGHDSIIMSVEKDIRVLDMMIRIGKKYKETGRYLTKDLTEDERHERASVIWSVHSSVENNKKNLEYFRIQTEGKK